MFLLCQMRLPQQSHGMHNSLNAYLEAGAELVNTACFFCLFHKNKEHTFDVELAPALPDADWMDF